MWLCANSPCYALLGLTGRFFRKNQQPRLAEGQPFSAGKELMSKATQNTRKLTGVAMLSAIGFILTFAYGPMSGAAVCLIKNVLHYFMGGTTGGVGELSNFLLGVAYVVPAGLIYQKIKTRKGALIASLIGCAVSAIYSLPHNYFLIYPLYGKMMPMEAILGMYQALNPSCDNLFEALLTFNVPFTFAKEAITAAMAFVIYKPLSPILHGRKK